MLSREGWKRFGFTKSKVFKELVTFLLNSIRFFHKKSKIFFDFVIFYVFFRRKIYSENLQVLKASFGQINERIHFFHFIINGFHNFGNIFFSKNKLSLSFATFFFLIYLLPSVINDKSHNTLSVFETRAMDFILRTKVWPYGFESVSLRKLTDFLFVLSLLFFL